MPQMSLLRKHGLVCATDTLALGVSKYLQEQRIENLQLASVGSTPLMKFLHPEIITVDPGYAEAGRQAASQLIETDQRP